MNGDRPLDEDAIRKLVARQMQAWAAGDPEWYASVFTSDADYVTFMGSHYKGRKTIAASYVPLFKKPLNGSRLHIEITLLRFLTPDVALILADAAVHGPRRRNRRNARVNTSVAVRRNGQWQLAASQDTRHRRSAEKLMGRFFSPAEHG
jgi:uncharacterized protein (TIGR02246 family)